LINNYFYKQVNKNINLAVPLYLIAAYAYYIDDDPLVSDDCFDWLAKLLQNHWDEITHHHKKYLSLDSLEAGTYLGKYPSIVEGAVKDLRMSNNL
jgi:NAD-dependent DNA ligase